MKRKLIALLLAAAMTVSATACGSSGSTAETGSSAAATEESAASTAEETTAAETGTEEAEAVTGLTDAYMNESSEVYNEALGEFYTAYQEATAETENVSRRYALMAIAEAKLMESATMLPIYSAGGNYRIGRIAPYLAGGALWGSDDVRYHNAIVTEELITAEDYNALKDLYNEVRGTGTYEDEAEAYLTEHGYTLKDTFNMPYSSDPTTWDVLATSRAADSEPVMMTYDGLAEYDHEGTLQPALAESWEVSDDGLTYTFHLREGLVWTDSQGRQVADLVADDFVAGMQHMMDAMGGLEYLVEGLITGATEYINGETTDFSTVGVSAPDDYTVVYTLEQPCSYFLTMLSYSVFAPMSRTYYESQGGKFGLEYDSSAADYTYGTSPDTIAYCGPYLITNYTEANTIVFTASDSYWNRDNINLNTITWLYNDGSDATRGYNDMLAGTVDYAVLNTSTLSIAQGDGNFDTYAIVTDTDATSYMAFFNLDRQAFANVNDTSTVVSPQTEEDAARTNAAMQNVHFRRALAFSVDRVSYRAQRAGEDLAAVSLRNTYTPATFVSLEEETTVSINGTDTTFPAGTYYGEIMQAQIDADGVTIQVWDAENVTGDGYDGWYNVDNAAAELATAVEELAAEGVTVDADNPIYVDLPYASNVEYYTNMANAFKQSVEAATDGFIIVNLVACADTNEWMYCGYNTTYGFEMNYDIYDLSGWAPDYGDPSTYLDTFLPDLSGYMTKCLGIF